MRKLFILCLLIFMNSTSYAGSRAECKVIDSNHRVVIEAKNLIVSKFGLRQNCSFYSQDRSLRFSSITASEGILWFALYEGKEQILFSTGSVESEVRVSRQSTVRRLNGDRLEITCEMWVDPEDLSSHAQCPE